VTTLGKVVRIERMKNPKSGCILTVAIDHAPSYGVLAGPEDIQQVVDEVPSAGPAPMLMMKGIAARCFSGTRERSS
jgi:DhnA family fructose-bisphosphate aldolase class Ia